MKRLIICLLVALLLTVPASAHPGDTDSSGGHYDHDTGEYHYHHGYPAHSHYDMDGDGDADCPYDFDDQTGQSSGSSSSSTRTSASSASTDYRRGYDDGHDDGYAEGKKYVAITSESRYEEGLEEGRSAGYSDGYAVGYAKARTLALWAAGLVSAFLLILGRHLRKDRKAAEAEAARQLQDDYGRLIHQRDREIEALRKELDEVRRDSAEQIGRLRRISNTSRISALLQSHDPGGRSGLQIPNGVEICGDVVSAGEQGPDTPYGGYTVYTSPHGKCYHSMRGCSGAYNPQCIQEMKYRKVPHCTRCVNLTVAMMQCPDWYVRYKQVIAGEYKPK